MYGYIYKTTNLLNGKIYIGQNKGVFVPTYFGSGLYLIRAIKKYGKEDFKVEQIASAETRQELNTLEIFYISKYRSLGHVYNISTGGEGRPGFKLSLETRELMRLKRLEYLKNHPHQRLGKKFTQESINKMRESAIRRCEREKMEKLL